jgi:metal-responsive CopG/Arc/MetJ family transcriptional regulator
MKKGEKPRVTVCLSADVLREVDKMAARLGWSRSKVVEYVLSQGVETATDVVHGLADLSLADVLGLLQERGKARKVK